MHESQRPFKELYILSEMPTTREMESKEVFWFLYFIDKNNYTLKNLSVPRLQNISWYFQIEVLFKISCSNKLLRICFVRA